MLGTMDSWSGLGLYSHPTLWYKSLTPSSGYLSVPSSSDLPEGGFPMPEIKAIQTVYNGYKFRSRLEARWAVFFDALELEFQYEKEGFDLGDGVRYLPDFYLPEMQDERGIWVEVKAQPPTQAEQEKAWRLSVVTGEKVLVAFLPPWERSTGPADGNWLFLPSTVDPRLEGALFTECHFCGRVGVAPMGDPRWSSCMCGQVAMRLASALTLDEMANWLDPSVIEFVHAVKTKAWYAGWRADAPEIIVSAGVRAKQARFEHGEKG